MNQDIEAKAERVTLSDFGTGILAGFVAEGYAALSVERLDKALLKSYESLQESPGELRFHIALHWHHGDAPQARRAIAMAINRGLGHFDSDGTLHINLESESLNSYFNSLPLTEESWRVAARAALDHIEGLTQ